MRFEPVSLAWLVAELTVVDCHRIVADRLVVVAMVVVETVVLAVER